jgi:selenocysteine lyase/cysteine desulfurase
MKTATAMAVAGVAVLREDGLARVQAAVDKVGGASPDELAGNEDFWLQIQQAYDVDRSLVNLNNGGVAPAPRVVLDAMQRHVEFTNHLPPRHLWEVLDKQLETVRERLAGAFGCDKEEIAIVRNASEALETCLLGIDLKPGDEVLTTSHDYPRMINTLKQRVRREGIVLKQFTVPTPPQDPGELAELFEKNITPKTRMILVMHISFMTGQIYPVKRIVQLGRDRGIPVIVDGAHAFAHFPFTHGDLDCDYYGTSMHKWLSAPIGTGFLFVRKSKIAGLWPLMAPPEEKLDDIRKFEEIGTHATAPYLAISEALQLYQSIGPERKAARLRYLRSRWASRLRADQRVTFYTSFDPAQSCGITTVGVEGIKAADLGKYLFDKHKILVSPIEHEHVNGIRVTPNTYTTPQEIEQFATAMEQVLAKGIG